MTNENYTNAYKNKGKYHRNHENNVEVIQDYDDCPFPKAVTIMIEEGRI